MENGKKDRAALAVRPGQREYAVGYAKPPEAHRFRKGVSGNPKGRPKGSKNKNVPALNEERLKSIILEEAYRDITVRDGDRMVRVPMAQAVMRALAVNAAKGQHRAQRLFAELLSTTEGQNKALNDEWLNVAITYKIEWERELHRRERLGITDLPPPLPHPGHVVIDMRKGTARIVGPATQEEKAEYDLWLSRKADFEEELEELEEMLGREAHNETRVIIKKEIAQTQRVLEIIQRLLPPA